jgi:hypothetical protein
MKATSEAEEYANLGLRASLWDKINRKQRDGCVKKIMATSFGVHRIFRGKI